jgi:hypothetical protein
MIRNIFSFILFICTPTLLVAQVSDSIQSKVTVNANDKSLHYFFNVGIGALIGCADCKEGSEVTFSTSTFQGIAGRKWKAGVVLGYDSYYNLQTTPIQATISYDLVGNRDKNALFIQAGYGASFAWRNVLPEYGYQNVEGGKSFSAQLGYRVRYYDLKLSFFVGTKVQNITTRYEYSTYYYQNGRSQFGTPSTTSVNQELNRIQVGISIGWR